MAGEEEPRGDRAVVAGPGGGGASESLHLEGGKALVFVGFAGHSGNSSTVEGQLFAVRMLVLLADAWSQKAVLSILNTFLRTPTGFLPSFLS